MLLYCASNNYSWLLLFVRHIATLYDIPYSNLDSSNKDIGDVDVENRRIFAFLLNENMIYKNCPTLLSCSLEYSKMGIKSEKEKVIINAIKNDENVKELIPKVTANRVPVNLKALCLTLAYMLRMNEIEDPVMQEELNYVLSKAPYLLEQMLQMAIILAMEFKFGRSRKRINARNVITLIAFSQNLIQGMWADDDAFLQLPHMDYEKLKFLRKKHKNLTLEQYCEMSKEQRLQAAIYEDPKHFEDSEQSILSFPLIDVSIEYFVEGEKEIAVGDILTIKLKITHKNLKDDDQLGFVHSNKFPYLKQSSWFLIFTDQEENDFMAMEKLVIKEKSFVKEIKERLQRPGKMQFFMILRNDSYKGFDKKVSVSIDVLANVVRAPVEYD